MMMIISQECIESDVVCFFMAGSDSKPGLIQNTGESTPKLLQDAFSSSKFQEMMKATSKHTYLLQAHDELVQDQYFQKLEKKEQLELKMMETYKVPCKAVQCAKVRILTVFHSSAIDVVALFIFRCSVYCS
jgi:hypothetical protein